MTPTMKVKRKKVTEKYKNQLEELILKLYFIIGLLAA